jgi:hypothetical protein
MRNIFSEEVGWYGIPVEEQLGLRKTEGGELSALRLLIDHSQIPAVAGIKPDPPWLMGWRQ